LKKTFAKFITDIEIKTLVVSILFLSSLFIFGYLADEVLGKNQIRFDNRVFLFLGQFRSPEFINVNRVLSFFGSINFIIPAYIILIILLWVLHRRNDAINVAIVGASSTLLMLGLKEVFHRHRPDLPLIKTLTNFSFPSGHALCSFIFCSAIIYLIDKGRLSLKWKWVFSILLVLFSVCIGISRIVLRYHYATDVLAGFCAAFAWVIFSLWIEKKLTSRRAEVALES